MPERASAQNHRVFSFLRNVRMSQVIRFISQYTLFFEQYRYHLQVDKAKISLCEHCLMNYFGISLLSLILTFSAHFSHCHYHVIVEVMFLLRL